MLILNAKVPPIGWSVAFHQDNVIDGIQREKYGITTIEFATQNAFVYPGVEIQLLNDFRSIMTNFQGVYGLTGNNRFASYGSVTKNTYGWTLLLNIFQISVYNAHLCK